MDTCNSAATVVEGNSFQPAVDYNSISPNLHDRSRKKNSRIPNSRRHPHNPHARPRAHPLNHSFTPTRQLNLTPCELTSPHVTTFPLVIPHLTLLQLPSSPYSPFQPLNTKTFLLHYCHKSYSKTALCRQHAVSFQSTGRKCCSHISAADSCQ